MQIKLFKWANVITVCNNDEVMFNAFNRFYVALSYCDWQIPSDIIRSFNSADIIKCKETHFNRVVFNPHYTLENLLRAQTPSPRE
ncbi:MAG: hypothetical protein GC181_16360 [Bacteroidetes bacterium]|nr:hypothetical protein [Bacteroidota bacterium]